MTKKKHCRKNDIKHSDKFLTLDQCIESNFNYESLYSCLTSHSYKKLSKKKGNNILSKLSSDHIWCFNFERKKVQKAVTRVHQRNRYVQILMDIDTSTLIIHKLDVNKNDFISRKTFINQWSIMAGSCSTSPEDKIELKLPELYVTAHISVPFYVTTKKSNNNVILVYFYSRN